MELVGTDMHITSGRAQTTMPTLPATEFPTITFPDSDPAMFTDGLLQQALRRVLTSQATAEDSRAIMTGTQFVWGPEGVTLCCTNGRSLGFQAIPCSGGEPREVVLGGAKHILSLAGDVEMRIADGAWSARSGPTTIGARILEGSFPDWPKLDKWEPRITAMVDRSGLLESLRRALLFSQDANSPGLLRFDITRDSVVITGSSAGTGEAIEELPCTCDGELAIAFNGLILAEALAVADVPTITWELQDATMASRMRLGQFVFLAMPVRMREVAHV